MSAQGDFFKQCAEEASPHEVDGIRGSRYYPAFLDSGEQERAMDHINQAPWLEDLERRVQHYGWRYDYRARAITSDLRLGPLPQWLVDIAAKLHSVTGLFDRTPDQAIVNEYEPGQGIAMHVDRQCFGPAVATISLGDEWQMDMKPVSGGTRENTVHIPLAPGSALVITGDARYRWMHGIAKRKRERDGAGWRPRKRRVSLTFRTVPMVGEG